MIHLAGCIRLLAETLAGVRSLNSFVNDMQFLDVRFRKVLKILAARLAPGAEKRQDRER